MFSILGTLSSVFSRIRCYFTSHSNINDAAEQQAPRVHIESSNEINAEVANASDGPRVLPDTENRHSEDQTRVSHDNDTLASVETQNDKKSSAHSDQPSDDLGLYRPLDELDARHGMPTTWTVPPLMRLTDITLHDPPEGPNRSGGLGNIHKGRYQGRNVAVKHLRCFSQGGPISDQCLQEFVQESAIWSKLEYPYVAPFLGIAAIASHPGYLMVSEWMKHGDLFVYLEVIASSSTRFQHWVNRLLYEVAQGIEYLHENKIVHGDIRAQNILINDEGHAVLTDFGSASMVDVPNVRDRESRMGALTCRAPELITGSGEPTFACDIYSFAILCVEVYAGQNPYANQRREHVILCVGRGDRPSRPKSQGQAMSRALWSLVKACWESKPSQRPSTSQVVHRMSKIVSQTTLNSSSWLGEFLKFTNKRSLTGPLTS